MRVDDERPGAAADAVRIFALAADERTCMASAVQYAWRRRQLQRSVRLPYIYLESASWAASALTMIYSGAGGGDCRSRQLPSCSSGPGSSTLLCDSAHCASYMSNIIQVLTEHVNRDGQREWCSHQHQMRSRPSAAELMRPRMKLHESSLQKLCSKHAHGLTMSTHAGRGGMPKSRLCTFDHGMPAALTGCADWGCKIY